MTPPRTSEADPPAGAGGPRRAAAAIRAGGRAGFLFGRIVRYHRRDALDAVRRAFPALAPGEVRALVDRMYAHLGMNVAEVLALRRGGEAWARRWIRWDGIERIREARAAGRGVCMLMAHAGNWEILGTTLPLFGLPGTIAVKPLRGPGLDAFVNRARGRFGLRTVPSRGSYRACLQALRRNDVLGFVLDQNMTRPEGAFVEFFGRPACTTLGLAHIAARAGAPVVPAFSVREADGGHRVRVGVPLPPPPDMQEETLRAATQQYTRTIEEHIRAHPGQWIWLHRRWRTQPA